MGSRYAKWLAVDSIGHAGGIVLLWDEHKVHVTNSWGGRFSLLALVKDGEKVYQWLLSTVCGPCQNDKKGEFWAELVAARGRWDEPWCLGGD